MPHLLNVKTCPILRAINPVAQKVLHGLTELQALHFSGKMGTPTWTVSLRDYSIVLQERSWE